MAVSELDDVHLERVRNYLEVFGLEVGLLPIFGRRSLEFKRLRNGVWIGILGIFVWDGRSVR